MVYYSTYCKVTNCMLFIVMGGSKMKIPYLNYTSKNYPKRMYHKALQIYNYL